MVLTDREIEAAIQNGHIEITPRPSTEAFSSTSLDLTLDPNIRVWKQVMVGVDQTICPAEPGYDFNTVAKHHTDSKVIGPEGLVLRPRDFVLAWTQETVHLPTHGRLAARVEGKSSLARLGIGVHVTAPIIHAGFRNQIQLEMCNHGTLKVRLMPGMRVCQLVFEQTLGTPDKGYSGQFQSR